MEYSDKELIDGFKNSNSPTLRFAYIRWKPWVIKYVCGFRGNIEDAEDVFQEGLTVIFQYCLKDDFELKIPLRNFFFSICKNIWIRKINRKNSLQKVTKLLNEESTIKPSIEKALIEAERNERFMFHFEKLGTKCQEVLKLYMEGMSHQEIADKLGYTYGTAKKKKMQCKNRLRLFLEDDDFFN